MAEDRSFTPNRNPVPAPAAAPVPTAEPVEGSPPPQRRPRERTFQSAAVKDGAEAVLALVIPVSICMALVVASIRSITYYGEEDPSQTLVYIAYTEDGSESNAARFGGAVVNALIIVGVVLAMTCLLVVLYKYRCYKIIQGWLIASTTLLLFLFGYTYFDQILDKYNLAMDYITFAITFWNFVFMGVLAVHWTAPLRIQQAYLIIVSALLALTLIKYLPSWTTWVLLAAIAIYDLFAVLCPSGPLQVLVKTAQERNEPLLPSLVYSSAMAFPYMMAGMAAGGGEEEDSQDEPTEQDAENGRASSGDSLFKGVDSERPSDVVARVAAKQGFNDDMGDAVSDNSGANLLSRGQTPSRPSAAVAEEEDEEEERGGVKLGLGDFIFYSVLVGKSATIRDWITVIACFIAILVGLVLTLLLLAIYKRALPALPISIGLGILFYFLTSFCLSPYIEDIAFQQTFI
eukprot:Clim_evm14s219 gene=Clim_evmTU14s219